MYYKFLNTESERILEICMHPYRSIGLLNTFNKDRNTKIKSIKHNIDQDKY